MNDYNRLSPMSNLLRQNTYSPKMIPVVNRTSTGIDKEEVGTSKDGYTLGNLFINTYNPYKNYMPKRQIAQSEKEALFLKMSELDFASHELNLFLDTHPMDEEKLELFNQYRKEAIEALENYERKYGPISTKANELEQSPFLWAQLPFPWKGGYK